MNARVLCDEPLAPRTTLELGGSAARLVVAESESDIVDIARECQKVAMPLAVLGGGSNVVVSDAGFRGTVLQPALRGVSIQRDGDDVLATVAAGEPWDAWVERTVLEGWQGLECLSGIPGWVGGAPIQNIGAYGQDISAVCKSVRVLDRNTLSVLEMPSRECLFSYRDSVFRSRDNPWIVLSVTFVLWPGAMPEIGYPELGRALSGHAAPTLGDVRETVLSLRRGKSMVLDPNDDNRRSAGSFFTNPIVDRTTLAMLWGRLRAAGLDPASMPQWPVDSARTKLSAAWLIEHSGFSKGMRRGAFGISSKHALALVHHGGGTTAALLAFAQEIRHAVFSRWGISLAMEPVLLGDFPDRS